MNVIGKANQAAALTADEIENIVAQVAGELNPRGKRVLVIIPDSTRSCPLPLMTRLVHRHVGQCAARMDFLIALGTHPPMSEPQIDALLGVAPGGRGEAFPGVRVFNHQWDNPAQLVRIGTLTKADVERISGGLFSMEVPVSVNKLVFDYDVLLILGPVFPHEVVGFSGGAKYFFPGTSGPELLNFFHWLGAVITNQQIIGVKDTPVRATVEAAAAMLPGERRALCMVVRGDSLAGLFYGRPQDAWSEAADLSRDLHIQYVDRPYNSVLSCAPAMYDELWVGAKCMYKLEPVVADGGELIIFAPHIKEISVTHGRLIEEIGYHTRDYFLGQWERFRHYPWGVLAHSTHVRGAGTYEGGVEKPRINVTLATGIPEATCRRINLGYRNPATIDPRQWQGKEAEGRLLVPKAGEMLYRLKDRP